MNRFRAHAVVLAVLITTCCMSLYAQIEDEQRARHAILIHPLVTVSGAATGWSSLLIEAQRSLTPRIFLATESELGNDGIDTYVAFDVGLYANLSDRFLNGLVVGGHGGIFTLLGYGSYPYVKARVGYQWALREGFVITMKTGFTLVFAGADSLLAPDILIGVGYAF
jgi:hypothetical protein